jgi:hypothetical protein
MIEFVTHVVAQLRTPAFSGSTSSINVTPAASTPATNPEEDVHQLLLFGEASGKAKRRRTAKAKAKRVKGKQYRMKLSFRATPRKIAYRPHASREDSVNEESWSEEGMRYLHSILLNESLKALRATCEKKSVRAAEIVAWMMRNEPTATFSFEECCRLHYMEIRDPVDGELTLVGAQDPEIVRCMALQWIKKAYGASLPHAKVLREAILAAEGGDVDAVDWILSDHEAPLSFVECVDALGFEPNDARMEIKLPAVDIRSHALERGLDDIFDRFFGPSSRAAFAA